ncbi:MAG: KUP/HAK/KT family potassium transporter [Candidatus Nanopelagicales bacterium]
MASVPKLPPGSDRDPDLAGLARLGEPPQGRGLRQAPPPVAEAPPVVGGRTLPMHPDAVELAQVRQRTGHPGGHGAQGGGHPGRTVALVVGATGIVFGDIGTSPLYAMKECLNAKGLQESPDTVLGIASLIFWALTLVVTIKYLMVIMRADNHGEGGILALLALLPDFLKRTASGKASLTALLILVGAGLLYGDGALTPAISVLSAVEGLNTLNPALESLVVPITCIILLVLFLVQSRGTHRLGIVFGPVMIAWFALIGGLGLIELVKEPAALKALLPTYAIATLTGNGIHGFLLLGSVILAVTGAEALYADMGHFGRRPIRLSWLSLAKPALVLAYLGQAAKVLQDPAAAENPLYALAPNRTWVLIMFGLATLATIIASQALITGVFSLTRQAVQLGYFPRVNIRHTSSQAEGQIYLPALNYMLMVACITLVIVFGSSARLAAAYGVAVSGTMAITSIAFYLVATHAWGWSKAKAGVVAAIFLSVDLSFLLATLPKFLEGGYVPIAIGAAVVAVMFVWHFGHNLMTSHMGAKLLTWDQVHTGIASGTIMRTPGTAVFLASNPIDVPQSMSSHITLLHTLPEAVRVVTIVTDPVPVVVEPDRFIMVERGDGIDQVVVRSGFMETLFVPLLMDILAVRSDPDYWNGPRLDSLPALPDDAIYFLSDRTFQPTNKGRMGVVAERMYAWLHRNSASPAAYFGLPIERVVTLGTVIDL